MLQASERELVEDYREIVTETDIGVAAQAQVYVHSSLLTAWLSHVLTRVLDSLIVQFDVPQVYAVHLVAHDPPGEDEEEVGEADEGEA